jgi:alkylation response protein AidB-like acyl-CoA dehydrogenase
MRLTDFKREVRDQFRKYMTTKLEAITPRLESGEELPYPFMKQMIADLGLAGTAEEHGRTGREGRDPERDDLMRFARTQIAVEISRVNPGFCMAWGASVGLCAGNILSKGTPEQVAEYVPPLMRGDKIGAWCLTEPGAGSDAFGSMSATARRDGDHFILNGSKTFITNGPYADVFLVYAKTVEGGSIEAFVVERTFAGVSAGAPFKKMGMKSSPTGEVFFDDVAVPVRNLLGGGMRDRDHVRRSLSSERIGIAAMSYGIAERCFEIARDYAKQRVQGGQPIANYQLVQNRLARMYVALANAQRIVYDRTPGESILEACAGKLYVAETATFITNEAIHILGGYGYMEEYTVERLARDAKLLELGGGTTEMQILTIARHILAE